MSGASSWASSLNDSDTRFSALRKAEKLRGEEREKAIAEWCWSIFHEFEAAKWEIAGTNHSFWNRLLDQVDGAQIPDKSDGRPKPRHNMTQLLIEEEKPTHVDVGVNLEVHPRQADDLEKASVLQDHLDYAMDQIKIADVDRKGVNWDLKLGTFGLKPYWDRDADDGMGSIRTAVIDPRKLFLPAGAVSIEASWGAALIDSVDMDKLIARHPKRKKELLEARGAAQGETRRGRDHKIEARLGRPITTLELWIRDPKTDADETVDADAAPGRPEYRDGRLFVVTDSNLVLRDEVNPFSRDLPNPGHGEFPVITAQCIDRHDTVFGRGNAELLDADQCELDVLETMESNWARMASANFIRMTRGARLQISKLSNVPFTIIKTRKGGDFGFETPPPLPDHVEKRALKIEARMRDRVGGGKLDVTAMTKRAMPVGTMQIAQETIEKLPRARIDNKNRAWADWARQALGLMRQFMPSARIVRLTSGRTVRVDPDILRDIDIQRFDIRIVPTGRTVYSRALNFAITAQLSKLGILGPIESMRHRRLMAESSGVKGAIELIADEAREQEEMAAAQEEAAAMAAMNGGAPGLPPGPPMPAPGARAGAAGPLLTSPEAAGMAPPPGMPGEMMGGEPNGF